MKYIKVIIETGHHTGAEPIILELDDDTTEEEMEESAKEEFFNHCSFGWYECDEDGDEL